MRRMLLLEEVSDIDKQEKICIPFKYSNSFNEVNQYVQEFDIDFIKIGGNPIESTSSNIDKLIEFVEANQAKNINISFPQEFYIPAVTFVNKIHKNIYIKLRAEQINHVAELKKNNIKFFFDKDVSAYNYAMLDSLITLGVSQLYISDDLCYNLDEVSKIAKSHGVKLRCVLNRIPATALDKGINYKSMVYRPQDLELLDKYFDCFEFDCSEPYDWAQYDVLFRAFFRRGKWNGNLQELNPDLAFEFDDRFIIPEYTSYKVNCERRCDSRYNNQCKKCEQFLQLQNLLIQKKMNIVRK